MEPAWIMINSLIWNWLQFLSLELETFASLSMQDSIRAIGCVWVTEKSPQRVMTRYKISSYS